jgi:hypothetical protein
MTFVWLTPVIVLVMFSTVILYQDRIERKSQGLDEDQEIGAVDPDEQMNA